MAIRISRRKNTRVMQASYSWRVMILPVFSALLCVSLVVAGVFAWRWMEKPTSFPIQHVRVQGELTHVSADAVKKVVETQLTGGFFSLNLATVKNSVLAFPWIAEVSFRRVWPDTLRVRLIEQKPLARFGAKGVLSEEGHLFYPDVKSIPQNLPDLDGPPDQVEALASFYQTANTLSKLIGLSVTSLRVNAMHSWYLQLSNQVLVKLGRQDALPRFKRFVTVYPQIIQTSSSPIVSVDLRYPDGVAVQFQTPLKNAKK